MNRTKAIFISATLAAAIATQAATVSVGTYVCNPGATVRVPVALDSARGLNGISVTLSYDPQVVVCSRVEGGGLAAVFDDDFLVANERAGTASATMLTLGGNVEEDVGGTVATFVFLARNGTAGQFSDVTVTKVELLEESGVRDATVGNPVAISNGMIRVMAADAAAARLEGAQTVVADTRLGSLALASGDGIQASDAGTPVEVTGAVSAEAAIPVAAPDHGWATGTYAILRTPTAGLSFASATNVAERLDVVESRVGGISTYTLSVSAVDGLAVVSLDGDLDTSLQAYVRECVGRPAGVGTVRVSGGAEAVSLAQAFGIRPAVTLTGGDAEATFAMPTVRITGFDVARRIVTAVVEPGEGNSIAASGTVLGVIEVLGRDSLASRPAVVDSVQIDLSKYFAPESAGEFDCTVTFGDHRFFHVRIRDK